MEKSEVITWGKPLRALISARAWFVATANDWPLWWSELAPLQKLLPAATISCYLITLSLLHGLRGDHFILGGTLLLLSYGGRAANRFLAFALPFLLTAIFYDSMRFYAEYIRGPVHVAEPYHFDKRFFGIPTEQGILTPNEYWQLHTHPVLDFVTGLAYLIFFSVFILQCAYFYFWMGHKGNEELSPAQAKEKAKRMGWSFFWLNMVGYTTYYWYAASPPWYVAKYGLGPARLDVPASQAGCARFDQLLGTHFFSEMYGRAADVHGAIPSLHVSYPLLAVLFAFQFKRMRTFSVLFFLLMCFSAVYLNHHYVLDILWGSTYAVLTAIVVDWLSERKLRNSTA